ncbi:MAG TPA: DUF4260 domain-containing protein [Flavitalea sp.]|nr:DUF4260 domain-containing protein [Flavitalea sp.]
MNTLLKIEELAMTAIAIYALSFHTLELSLWIWVLLFFSPDISMLGYLVNAKVGAFTYNLFHHKAIALLVIAAGYFLKMEVILSIGILLFAHSSFDRIWGYGLKYTTGFKDTHLGSLEKKTVIPG